MKLFDTHAHLNDEALANEKGNIIAALNDAGVEGVIEVGYDAKSSKQAAILANEYSFIYAAVGIHPQESERVTKEDFDSIRESAMNAKVVAIGEIGLDYHYDYDRNAQKSVFIRQIALADDLKLPMVIHLRDAYEDTEKILTENAGMLNHGLLFHCYSGSSEMIKRFDRFDPYYAFGGAVTFKNADKGGVVRAVRADRLLLETDCPYMTPVPYRGKPNSPLYLRYTAQKVAQLLDKDVDLVAETTTANAKRFFAIK